MNITVLFHPEDATAAEACATHLATLRRAGHKVAIVSTSWGLEEQATLLTTEVVVALFSAPLTAWWDEALVARLLEENLVKRRMRILPVLLRACELPSVPAELQALPRAPVPPIMEQSPARQDTAWVEVVRGVRGLVTGGGS